MAKQVIGIGTTANDGTGDPLRTAFNKANDNFTELYNGAGGVADDSVTYAKLGTEFTTSAALATNVDFSTAQVFTKTLTGATTLTFSNAEIGMVKDLVITGDFGLTFTSGTINTITGTYDGTVENLIQVVCTASNVYWMTISQPTV